jgi:hypothetical protein
VGYDISSLKKILNLTLESGEISSPIKMANLDGSLGKTLIDKDLGLPRAIVVHPNAG